MSGDWIRGEHDDTGNGGERAHNVGGEHTTSGRGYNAPVLRTHGPRKGYVVSGGGAIAGRAGNVLLAFGVE